MRSVVIMILALLSACESKPTGAQRKGAPDAAPPDAGATAAPAPTFCDGKDCPCKLEKDPWERHRCTLAAPLVVQGVSCGPNNDLYFYADGRLSECTLAAPVRVGPYLCKQGIYFHKDGTLKRCLVEGTYTVSGIALEARQPYNSFDLELFPDGKLHQGELAAPTKFGDRTCQESVTLYKEGMPYGCEITEPLVHADGTLPPGTPVLLNRKGELTGFFPQDKMTWKGKELEIGWAFCLEKDCNSLPKEE